MSYKTEFPDYDGKLYIPEGFTDTSWHNDIMPKAEKCIEVPSFRTNEIIQVRYIIWQDYVNPALREYENGKRFIFQIEIKYERKFEHETDNLTEIQTLVNDIVFDD